MQEQKKLLLPGLTGNTEIGITNPHSESLVSERIVRDYKILAGNRSLGVSIFVEEEKKERRAIWFLVRNN